MSKEDLKDKMKSINFNKEKGQYNNTKVLLQKENVIEDEKSRNKILFKNESKLYQNKTVINLII